MKEDLDVKKKFFDKDFFSQSTDVLNTVLDNITQGIVVVGPDYRILAFNRHFEDLFQLPNGTVSMGVDFREVLRVWAEVTGQDKQMLDHAIVRLDEAATFQFEFPQLMNGERRWCLLIHNPLPGKGFVRTFADITDRKRAEEVLQAREKQLAEAQRITHIGSWEHNLTTGQVSWSDELFRLLGLDAKTDPADINIFFNMVHSEDLPVLKKAIDETLRLHMPFNIEYRIILKNGSTRILYAQAELIHEGNGYHAILRGTCQDITERKRVEESLCESEADLNEAQNIAKMGRWELNLANNNLKWSDSVYKLFEIDQAEFGASYEAFLQAIHHDDREMVNKAYMDSLKNKQPYEIMHRLLMKDGRVKWVLELCRTDYNLQGQAIRSVGIVQDITALKLAEEKLREEEFRYRTLIENAHDGIVVAQAGLVKMHNTRCAIMLGISSDEIDGHPISEFIYPEDLPMVYDRHKRRLEGATDIPNTYSFRVQIRDGSPLWVDFSTTIITWEGKPATLNFLHDISDQKRLEQDLINTKEAAEAASKAKSLFLANMSHEMRTPLQSILSYHVLLSRTQLTEEQKGYIKPISNSALLLKTLVNDILDLEKIEQGNIHLNSIPFDIRDLLRSTVGIHHPEAERKGLSLNCLIAPEVPARLKGDPERLGQIFHNVVINAIKFTEKGRVDIQVEHKAGFAVSKGVCNGVELLCCVRDSGIGIAKDKQKVIFEHFTQGHEGYSRRYGGSGLGLSICHKLLQHMGGSIWVESDPNKGSTFYFTAKFDVAGIDEDREIPFQRTQTAVIAGSNRKKKILIVDDEIQCSYGMETILKAEGYAVATAFSGTEALARCGMEEFDLIFMDISMPEMDGIEATKLIREGEKGTGRHALIIALTGHGYDSDIAKFKQAGMDNWLIKPITYDDLITMMDNYRGVP